MPMYISCPRAALISPRSRMSVHPKDFKTSVTFPLASASLPERKIVWSPLWTILGFTMMGAARVLKHLTTLRFGKAAWIFPATERSSLARARGKPLLKSSSLAVSMRTFGPTLSASAILRASTEICPWVALMRSSPCWAASLKVATLALFFTWSSHSLRLTAMFFFSSSFFGSRVPKTTSCPSSTSLAPRVWATTPVPMMPIFISPLLDKGWKTRQVYPHLFYKIEPCSIKVMGVVPFSILGPGPLSNWINGIERWLKQMQDGGRNLLEGCGDDFLQGQHGRGERCLPAPGQGEGALGLGGRHPRVSHARELGHHLGHQADAQPRRHQGLHRLDAAAFEDHLGFQPRLSVKVQGDLPETVAGFHEDKWFLGRLLETEAVLPRQGMPDGQGQKQFLGQDRLVVQPGPQARLVHDGQLDLALLQIPRQVRGGLFLQVDLDLRVSPAEGRQDGREQVGPGGGHAAQADLAQGEPGLGLGILPGRFHLLQDRPDPGQKGGPPGGQPPALAGALEKRPAQLVLQLGDLDRKGRLGHVALPGRLGETARLGHGQEVAQLVGFHFFLVVIPRSGADRHDFATLGSQVLLLKKDHNLRLPRPYPRRLAQ